MNEVPKGHRHRFTVFTPTFNRAHTLSRVYQSLCAQTFRDFEWLIVDDGSDDNTRNVVESWNREAQFPIRYIWQENRGKHVAFNRGVAEASGELFLPLDSDDACVPQALERFIFHWEAIPSEERGRFAAVTALCVDQDGNLIGERFPRDVLDSDSLELLYRYRVRGEKWGFHTTAVLRAFPFPEMPDTPYLPEGLVWTAIARQFKTRFVNEPLRIYWRDGCRGSRQLTASPFSHGVGGRLVYFKAALNQQMDYFRFAPEQFFRFAVSYARSSFHVGLPLLRQLQELTNHTARMLWTLAVPLGFILYCLDAAIG